MKKILYFILFISAITQARAQSLAEQLQAQGLSIQLRLNQYDTSRYNLLIGRHVVDLKEQTEATFMGSRWKIQQKQEATNQPGRYKISLLWECVEGTLSNASLSLDVVAGNWSTSNYVLMPSAVYNGNRYPAVRTGYMPFFNEKEQLGLDKPILLSNQPRLNVQEGVSRIQQRSGAMAFPSIGYRAESGKGFWLFASQGNSLGDYGMDIEELKGRKQAVISLTSPVVREVRKYFIADMDFRPSDDKPANFRAGDRVEMAFYLDLFECPTIQALYDRMADIRQQYFPAPEKRHLLPFSAAFAIQEQKFNRDNWNPEGYYKVGVTENFFQDWQIGWTGGMIYTLPLLMEGDQLTRSRVLANFDWLHRMGLSPSGYYYDLYYKGKPYGAFPNKALGDSLVLTRKNADAVYYIYKQFDLMKKMGIPVKPEWEEMNRKAMEAQIATWKEYRQLGQFVNQHTGKIVVGQSASAGLFPAALCAGFRYTGNADYLALAEEIGRYFYDSFVAKGLTYGGPGDAVQSFDSESSYALLESFTELYESTGKQEWLQRAEQMARQFSSWVIAYDYKFPATSLFAKLDIRSNGAVYANTQNTHGAPGICTHSGIALLKLYRATGNPFYMQLLSDIAHALPQYMSWKDRPWPGFGEGWMSERSNLTDWLEGIGETFVYSGWSETALMLSKAELPGVYLDLQRLKIFAADHVEASIVRSNNREVTVQLHNPTPYPARVKVLAENAQKAAQPLLQNAALQWQQVSIAPGASAQVRFRR